VQDHIQFSAHGESHSLAGRRCLFWLRAATDLLAPEESLVPAIKTLTPNPVQFGGE
jgi:hypothetical protein